MTKPVIDKSLSDDAKAVLGGWFGMGMPTRLEFRLVESRPTARTATALMELVAKKVLSLEPFEDHGLMFRPLIDTQPYMNWLGSHKKAGQFTLMEPIGG